MQPLDQNQSDIDARYRTLLILWAAMFVSVLSFLLFINLAPVKPVDNPRLSLILNIAGIAPVAMSFVLKIKILQKAVDTRRMDLVQTAYVLAFGLCEMSAILGLMSRYLTGSNDYYIGLGFGLFGILLHLPRKKYLLAAADKEF
jgi:hypothetical protein